MEAPQIIFLALPIALVVLIPLTAFCIFKLNARLGRTKNDPGL